MSVLNTWKSQENSGSIFDIKQRISKEEEHICLHKKIVRLYPNYNSIVTSAELWLRLAETVNSMTLNYRIQKLRLYIKNDLVLGNFRVISLFSMYICILL